MLHTDIFLVGGIVENDTQISCCAAFFRVSDITVLYISFLLVNVLRCDSL